MLPILAFCFNFTLHAFAYVVVKPNPALALDPNEVGIAATFVPIQVEPFYMGHDAYFCGEEGQPPCFTLVDNLQNFEMQATEVTQYQYFLVTGKNPSFHRTSYYCDEEEFKVTKEKIGICSQHPVERVSFLQAQAFADALNQIQTEYVYRLPTEAEWEFAAKQGGDSKWPYFFGYNDAGDLHQYAWLHDIKWPRRIASKSAHPNGTYDLYGNVSELVNQQWSEGESKYTFSKGGNYTYYEMPSGESRAIALKHSSPELGFRLVRTKK